MRNKTRFGRLAVVITLFIGTVAAFHSQQAGATETPIYNAPAGGGPVTQLTFKVGPFTLDPVGNPNDQTDSAGLVPRPPGAFAIKSATFDLVDENDVGIGRHDVHLHHFVIAALNHEDTACPDRKVFNMKVQPLIGSGMERTPIDLPDPYAIKVDSTDQWGAQWHLMNMSNVKRTFWVKYTLGIQTGATADNTRYVIPFWADSNSCPAGTTWNVPGDGGPNGVEVRTKQWAMPFDGYLVGVGGHLHDGGLSIVTKHEDDTFICENEATYAGGMLDKISRCPVHDTFKQGEKLSVSSFYDNSGPHPDVMGIAVMFLWPGDQGVAPEAVVTSSTSTTSTTTSTSTTSSTSSTSTSTSSSSSTSTTTSTPVNSTTTTTAPGSSSVLGTTGAAPAQPIAVSPFLAG